MTGLLFTKAVRRQARLRLGLEGPSGSGKTYGALLIAKGIGGKIAVIDTEHESSSLYAGLEGMPEFDSLNLPPPYTPERFSEAVRQAEEAGYDTLVIDSITHEWNGVGGVLELLDDIARAKYRGNTWSAWNEMTPRHRAFIDSLLRSKMHIIATMRSKTETTQEDAGNGKKKVVKLGMKAEQREGTEYEFTTVLSIIHDGHFAMATKDRTGLFGGDPVKITEATGWMLREWLESGAEPMEGTPAPVSVSAEEKGAMVAATVEDLKQWFRDAAMNGLDALKVSYEAAVNEPNRDEVWATDGRALRLAAKQADATATGSAAP